MIYTQAQLTEQNQEAAEKIVKLFPYKVYEKYQPAQDSLTWMMAVMILFISMLNYPMTLPAGFTAIQWSSLC